MPMWPCLSAVSDNVICGLMIGREKEGQMPILPAAGKTGLRLMRHEPLERDINIAVNGCSWFATSTQKGPFTAMLISHSRGTYLIYQAT